MLWAEVKTSRQCAWRSQSQCTPALAWLGEGSGFGWWAVVRLGALGLLRGLRDPWRFSLFLMWETPSYLALGCCGDPPTAHTPTHAQGLTGEQLVQRTNV